MTEEIDMTEDELADMYLALSDRDWWAALAPKGWVVGGFTYRNSVTYHKIVADEYQLSASFDYGQVAFLKELIKELTDD